MKRWSVFVLLVGLLAAALPIPGQTPPAPSPEPATLSFENREIITLRAMRGVFTPAERVNATDRRLRETLKKPGPHEIRVDTIEGGYAVFMDSTPLVSVLPGDVDRDVEGRGTTVKSAAEEVAQRLRDAVQARSDQRRVDVIVRGVLHSLIALAIAGVAIWMIRRARVAVLRRLSDTARYQVEHQPVAKSINFLDPALRCLRLLVDTARAIAVTTIVYLWLT